MTTKDEQPGQSPRPGNRLDRSERRRKAAAARATALRLAGPSPLPPHPEGLKPPVWPALAMIAAILIAGWSWPLAVVGVGLVLAYAIATRNDKRRHFLYAYVQGHRQFRAGDYEAALANFQDLEEAGFAPPAVLRAIGLTNYQLGRWAEAATYLEDVPNRTPEEEADLAHALVELGEVAEAVRVLDAAKELPPVGRVVRAVADFRLGRPAKAAARLEAVLAEAGGENDAPHCEPYLGARYWLGLARRAAGDGEGAGRVLEALYEIDPGYHDVASLLGRPAPGPADET